MLYEHFTRAATLYISKLTSESRSFEIYSLYILKLRYSEVTFEIYSVSKLTSESRSLRAGGHLIKTSTLLAHPVHSQRVL